MIIQDEGAEYIDLCHLEKCEIIGKQTIILNEIFPFIVASDNVTSHPFRKK